jgi:uncharacterized protein (TIGR02231 family)
MKNLEVWLKLASIILLGITKLHAVLLVSTSIDSVVLFTDRALVFRKAVVNLSSKETVKITDLSGMLDDNSIRIKAENLRIGEVQTKRTYEETPTGKVKELKDSIRFYELKEKERASQEKVLEAQENFLSSIKLAAPEIISKELHAAQISPTNWREALNFLNQELIRVKTKMLELSILKEEYGRKLERWRKELADIQATVENRKELNFEVEAKNPGSYELEIFYIIPYASQWRPYYEIRAFPEKKELEFSYYAQISQRTGEDWENTKIILTTQQPPVIGILPEIYPWTISLIDQPSMVKQTLARKTEAQAFEAEAKAEMAPSPVETGISLRYPLVGKVTIKSGDPPKKLPIATIKIPCDFEYFTFPKANELVFLSAKLQNTSNYIFLSGPGNTYVGSEYTGNTYLQTFVPGESLTVNLGTDSRVKVKRELIRTFTSSVGVFGKRIRQEYSYRTTLDNFYGQAIKVKLVEQVPVSQHKDLEIKVTRVEPGGYEENRDLGTFTWYKEIPPQNNLIINLDYYLEYPKGKILSGY